MAENKSMKDTNLIWQVKSQTAHKIKKISAYGLKH